MHTESHSFNRGQSRMGRSRGSAGQEKKWQQQSPPPEPTKESSKETPEETIASHLDQIDKTINEILSSSALENVATYV